MNKQIELSCGFEELRLNLNDFKEMKEEKDRGKVEEKRKLGTNYQQYKRRVGMK